MIEQSVDVRGACSRWTSSACGVRDKLTYHFTRAISSIKIFPPEIWSTSIFGFKLTQTMARKGSSGAAGAAAPSTSGSTQGQATSPARKKVRMGLSPKKSLPSPSQRRSDKSSKNKGARGILLDKERTDDNLKIAFASSGSLELLFGDTKGAPLIDAIFFWFGDGVVDVPWYSNGSRGIIPSPLNRQIQETVCESYKDRILDEGLSQDVAGILGNQLVFFASVFEM
jgi:hypothetical protein